MHESKVGRTSLTKSVKTQVLKDVALKNDPLVREINDSIWHFYNSPVTGKGGPTKPLADFLTANGIKHIIH